MYRDRTAGLLSQRALPLFNVTTYKRNSHIDIGIYSYCVPWVFFNRLSVSVAFYKSKGNLSLRVAGTEEEDMTQSKAPSIDITNLNYVFPDGSTGLKDVILSLPPGSRTLLIGGETSTFLSRSECMRAAVVAV